MGSKEKNGGERGLSRRDFLKVSAAGTALGAAGLDFALRVPAAGAITGADGYYHTTCPYCSASCGQIVAVSGQTVLDIYGDDMSPINLGGLCAKGAGAYQHVTNSRRIGAFAGTHPVNGVFAYDPAFGTSGVVYKRTDSTGAWTPMTLASGMKEIADRLITARNSHQVPDRTNGFNSKGVAFLGCSHMNNEQNYTYRKLIAQFGSSNTEHQARI